MRVVSVAEMRALEAATFATGVEEPELQLRAARAVAETVERLAPPGEVVALVGPGNNGRDAYLAVRHLLGRGWEGGLFLTPRHGVTDAELRDFIRSGGRLTWHAEEPADLALEAATSRATLVLDGLLGIGARGEPRSPLAEIIDALNRRRSANERLVIVSVDGPSGVDADTGAAPGAAVAADASVVLGGAKRGLLTPSAARYTGQLFFTDIGLVAGPPDAPQLVTAESVRGTLPRTPPDAHKGRLGRLLVVAGSDRYVGAAFLVCAAAVRAGAGLVTLAAPGWLRDVVAGRLPEITYLPLPESGPAGDPATCGAAVCDALPSYQALALGPGLSIDGATEVFVEAVLRRRAELGTPAIIDADGLNALAHRPGWPEWVGDRVVLTPHAGELRRLALVPDEELPWETVRRLSNAWPVTLVLKGPFTSIGASGRTWVHARPNPGLATAGTGDVLAGLLGGLLARGASPGDAARIAVWAHAEAGARAAEGATAGGLAASDLIAEIPKVVAEAFRHAP